LRCGGFVVFPVSFLGYQEDVGGVLLIGDLRGRRLGSPSLDLYVLGLEGVEDALEEDQVE